MPSLAFQAWASVRAAALNDIENAHLALRGVGPGVRTATQQINQAYTLLLSAQFQAFCRGLHTECADHLVTVVPDPDLRGVMRANFLRARKLDHGNPNPGNIGSDFAILGIPFWAEVAAHRPKNAERQMLLQELNDWRNAVAHQDFPAGMLTGGSAVLRLARVRAWRQACAQLAVSFDAVVRHFLRQRLGISPW